MFSSTCCGTVVGLGSVEDQHQPVGLRLLRIFVPALQLLFVRAAKATTSLLQAHLFTHVR